MADLLIKQAGLATGAVFKSRVRLAMVQYALTVQGEAQGGASSTVWQKRQQLSERVLNASETMIDRFAWAVVADTAITTATPAAITSSTNAAPSVVTTSANHLLAVGDTVEIIDHLVNTRIVGGHIVFAVPTATTFTVPVAASGAGTATGYVVKHPTDQLLADEIVSAWNKIAGVTVSDG